MNRDVDYRFRAPGQLGQAKFISDQTVDISIITLFLPGSLWQLLGSEL